MTMRITSVRIQKPEVQCGETWSQTERDRTKGQMLSGSNKPFQWHFLYQPAECWLDVWLLGQLIPGDIWMTSEVSKDLKEGPENTLECLDLFHILVLSIYLFTHSFGIAFSSSPPWPLYKTDLNHKWTILKDIFSWTKSSPHRVLYPELLSFVKYLVLLKIIKLFCQLQSYL